MAESTTNRLFYTKTIGFSSTGVKFWNFTAPAGYRVVSAWASVAEDANQDHVDLRKSPFVYASQGGTMVDSVSFAFVVSGTSAVVECRIIVERSDEPDVTVTLTPETL